VVKSRDEVGGVDSRDNRDEVGGVYKP